MLDTHGQELIKEYMLVIIKATRASNRILEISPSEKTAIILQMQALSYLQEYPHATVVELSQELHMSSASVAQFTSRLARAGFIHKEKDYNDRRTIRLSLTSHGKKS